MDRIDLAQDRDQWRALVYMVMDHLAPCLEILEWLSDWWLLKKDLVPQS
jgi:hypothetical protein